MDYRDLMFGDWIQVERGFDGHLTNERVKGVIGDEDERYPVRLFTGETVSFNDIHPIPLTEEILEKTGFVYREEEETCATVAFHHWQLNGHSFALNYTQYFRKEKKDDMPRFDVAGIAIHYVHQLQHLLRMAGVQKEIEL